MLDNCMKNWPTDSISCLFSLYPQGRVFVYCRKLLAGQIEAILPEGMRRSLESGVQASAPHAISGKWTSENKSGVSQWPEPPVGCNIIVSLNLNDKVLNWKELASCSLTPYWTSKAKQSRSTNNSCK